MCVCVCVCVCVCAPVFSLFFLLSFFSSRRASAPIAPSNGALGVNPAPPPHTPHFRPPPRCSHRMFLFLGGVKG